MTKKQLLINTVFGQIGICLAKDVEQTTTQWKDFTSKINCLCNVRTTWLIQAVQHLPRMQAAKGITWSQEEDFSNWGWQGVCTPKQKQVLSSKKVSFYSRLVKISPLSIATGGSNIPILLGRQGGENHGDLTYHTQQRFLWVAS